MQLTIGIPDNLTNQYNDLKNNSNYSPQLALQALKKTSTHLEEEEAMALAIQETHAIRSCRS
jgi:hypothetical protein